MIILNPLTDNSYKVIIDTTNLTDEERVKLLRKRDLFPAEFVSLLVDLIPEEKTFDTYSHFDMVLNVK